MTGRTHDLAAFTALTFVVATQPLPQMTLATTLVAFAANMIGGLAPDIDQPTANLWNRLPAGGIIGRIFTPFFGGHRFISHSLLGIILFGFITKILLELTASFLIVDRPVVWWAFMIGFISHLVIDTFTRDGVPWFFPLPINIGIPPLKFMRLKTGGLTEKSFVFPGLLMLNVYIFYEYHKKFLDFLHHYIK